MANPIALALGAGKSCTISVSDDGDGAVHTFDCSGQYLVTRSARGARSPFAHIVSFASAPGQGLYLSQFGHRGIAIVDSQDRLVDRWDAGSQWDTTFLSEAQLSLVNDTVLADNWFAGSVAKPSRQWMRLELPLISLIDTRTGRLFGSLGRIEGFPGSTLTAALNRGYVGAARDTVWFARAADGVVLGFPITEQGSPARVTIALPLFFRARAPIEYRSRANGTTTVQLESQLQSFSVSPSGRWFVMAQSTGWTDPSQSRTVLYRPRNLAVVMDRTSGQRMLYDLGGQVARVVASDRGFVAIVSDTLDGRRMVRMFPYIRE